MRPRYRTAPSEAPSSRADFSHGNRTDDGERFAERALTASVTCRLQARSLFTYLADLLTAHSRGDPLTTLAWPAGQPRD